ncbi:MAG: LysR substrate-binding domain-containing protein [Rubrivivax sp.]
MNRPRHRPLSIGALRAFEAVARRLGFGSAAEELHLTQPAVSRQIHKLEDELGTPLFLRGTRHVELTGAGSALLRSVAPLIDRLDAAVHQIRTSQTRSHVGIATFASLASLWLIPRLAAFQAQAPEMDIRISASDALADPEDPEIDLALRYGLPRSAPPDAVRLFDEVLTPVAAPSLLQRQPLRDVGDLARHTLLEEDDHRPSAEYLSWQHWLKLNAPPRLEPRGWVYLNYTYQQIQAALSGQGLALARMAMVVEPLARGELVEPFGAAGRVRVPHAYWLLRWAGRRERPELAAFEAWLLSEARDTQARIAAALGTVEPAAALN